MTDPVDFRLDVSRLPQPDPDLPPDYAVKTDCRFTGQTAAAAIKFATVAECAKTGGELTAVLGEVGGGRPRWGYADGVARGRELYERLLPGAAGRALRAAVETARAEGTLLRVQVRIPDDPMLHEVPWELLYDGQPGEHLGFVALCPQVLFARYITQAGPVQPAAVPGPLRVLAAAACPAGQHALAFERDFADLRAGLVGAVVDERAGVGAAGLREHLTREPVHVLHLVAHGGLVGKPPRFKLSLEGPDGKPEWVDGPFVADVIADQPALRLVVLSVCHSGTPGGLAHALARLNIPAVLGYRTRILDRIAVRFGRALYEHLRDRPIDQAVRDARLHLFGTDRELDWALPVLYLRTEKAVLTASAGTYRPAPSAARDISDFESSGPAAGAGAGAVTPTQAPVAQTQAPVAPPPPAPVRPAIENDFGGARIKKVISVTGASAGSANGGGILNRFTDADIGVAVSSGVLTAEEMKAFFVMIKELS